MQFSTGDRSLLSLVCDRFVLCLIPIVRSLAEVVILHRTYPIAPPSPPNLGELDLLPQAWGVGGAYTMLFEPLTGMATLFFDDPLVMPCPYKRQMSFWMPPHSIWVLLVRCGLMEA
jgi:hypothetical protein